MSIDHEAEIRNIRAETARMEIEHTQQLLDCGIMRMHKFTDGRRLSIVRRVSHERTIYFWTLSYNSLKHQDGIGFQKIEECEALAKFLFGNKGWNRFDGEKLTG